LNINEAKQETRLLIETGQAVMWSSGSGIGKSSSAFQLFEELKAEGAKNNETWGMGVIFAATQTPPDLIGYQFKGERDIITGVDANGAPITKKVTVTDPSIPLWMISTEGKPAFLYDKFFLLIDEYGQGEGDVKRALAEIFLNGGTSPWYLPPGSVRLACTNEGARYGVSKDFDFCIARRTLLKISPDVDAFIQHVDKPYTHQGKPYQVMAVTKAWAKAHPTEVFEDEPKQQGPWCTPRQLVAADRYLQNKFALTGKREFDARAMEVVAGTIGMPATTSLGAHLTFALNLPSYDDVVADPAGTDVPTKADMQMLMAYELAGSAKLPDLGPVIQYVMRMPKDMGVTFVSALLRRDYRGFSSAPPMMAWINKNATLVSIISSLAH
jgi:hypothetical protein